MRAKKIELLKYRTYLDEEYERILIELLYRVHFDDGSVKRYYFPKVGTPFRKSSVPIVSTKRCEYPYCGKTICLEGLLDDVPLFPIGDSKFDRLLDGNGMEINLGAHSDECYLEIQDKEPDPAEMTLEEVERRLGKKVKIVSRHGECHEKN